jgi:hypothetical protein
VPDEHDELDDVELDDETAEALPDREAMSIVTPFPGEEMPGLEPLRGGEQL